MYNTHNGLANTIDNIDTGINTMPDNMPAMIMRTNIVRPYINVLTILFTLILMFTPLYFYCLMKYNAPNI